jgi:hypothetical protein
MDLGEEATRMRFLLRLAFWLGVVAVLLPRSEQQPPSAVQVRASDAVAAASATVADMAKFCDRQPEACTVGTEAAEVLGDRARAGAKRLYEMLNEKLVTGDKPTASVPSLKSVPLPPTRPIPRTSVAAAPHGAPAAPQSASQNTLTPADLAPLWQGPVPRKDPREPT